MHRICPHVQSVSHYGQVSPLYVILFSMCVQFRRLSFIFASLQRPIVSILSAILKYSKRRAMLVCFIFFIKCYEVDDIFTQQFSWKFIMMRFGEEDLQYHVKLEEVVCSRRIRHQSSAVYIFFMYIFAGTTIRNILLTTSL